MHVGFNDWSEDKNLVVEPIAMEPAVELVEKTPEANATIAAVWMNVMDGVADSVVPPEVSKEEDLKDTDWMKAEVRYYYGEPNKNALKLPLKLPAVFTCLTRTVILGFPTMLEFVYWRPECGVTTECGIRPRTCQCHR
jgi:hypothetical protein